MLEYYYFCYGKIGVNIFVLISGFFLINSKFKVRKFIKIIFQVLFYSVSILFVNIIVNKEITFIMVVKTITSFMSLYWFISIYIAIYLLSPFINKLIKSINKLALRNLILILVFLFVIVPTFIGLDIFMGELQWFLLMYLVGAYIQLYDKDYSDKRKLYIAIACIIFAIEIIVGVVLSNKISNPKEFLECMMFLGQMNFLPITIISILIFLIFKDIKMKNNNYINKLSQGSFAVYLFHDNPYIRAIIWKNLCKTEMFLYSNAITLCIHILICTISIYTVGCLIEMFRCAVANKIHISNIRVECFLDKIDEQLNF